MRKIGWMGAFAFLCMCVFGLQHAEASPKKKRKRPPTIVLKKQIVRGKRHKPQAFYILHRAPFHFKMMKRKRNVLQRVIRSVNNKPF
ncbi:MAG TPA: hypothetical protein DCE42_26390 [Myxococcales bacterium]|nr:hypothetical protein [Deltaproteobacteria bacterium]MBU50195.1 hypothetical protein [Deltaproteobacteria bacterium]HAA58319.1 hypothetical protein [Myxococcales bacterium]|tara:strand:+ start:5566 stop:5826 length:261 start_codon:yes stop_codon:yes gene_type:complete